VVGAKPRLDGGGYVYDTAVNSGGGVSSEPTYATFALPPHTKGLFKEAVHATATSDHAVTDPDVSHPAVGLGANNDVEDSSL
jgi:hypothetical protein